MEYQSNPHFLQPFNGRKHFTNNNIYHRELEQRLLQVQAQQWCHQETVSQRANQFLSAQKARTDAVKTRLGLHRGPPGCRAVPHPPVLSGSPQYSSTFHQKFDWCNGSSFSYGPCVTPLSSVSSKNCSVLPPLQGLRESPLCSDNCRERNAKANGSYVSNFGSHTAVTPLSSLSSVNTHTPDELRSIYPITPEPLCERFSNSTHENQSRFSTCSSVSITPLSSLSSVDTHIPDELRYVYPITPSPEPTPPLVHEKPKQSRLPVLWKRLASQSSQISASKVKDDPQCPCSQELMGGERGDWLKLKEYKKITVQAPAVVPAPPAVTPTTKYSSKTARIALKAKESRAQMEIDSDYQQWPSVVPAPPAVTPTRKYSSKTARIALKAKESRAQKEIDSDYKQWPSVVPISPAVTPTRKYSSKTARIALKPKESRAQMEIDSDYKQWPSVVPISPAVTPTTEYSSKTARIALKPKESRAHMEIDSDYRPLHNPGKSLTLALEMLESNDWMKKVAAFKIIQSLVRHHKSAVLPKLRDICLVLSQEVKSVRSCVACAAISTMTDLFIYLGALMDAEVEQTCRSLLLRLAQGSDAFILERVGRALDALVENCSPKRVTVELLHTGMSHRSAAVRVSAAEHLKQVLNQVGAEIILSSAKGFIECFLIGVAKMAVDAAAKVRCFGIQILMDIAKQENFYGLWVKYVPDRDQHPLYKLFKKLNLPSGQ